MTRGLVLGVSLHMGAEGAGSSLFGKWVCRVVSFNMGKQPVVFWTGRMHWVVGPLLVSLRAVCDGGSTSGTQAAVLQRH